MNKVPFLALIFVQYEVYYTCLPLL